MQTAVALSVASAIAIVRRGGRAHMSGMRAEAEAGRRAVKPFVVAITITNTFAITITITITIKIATTIAIIIIIITFRPGVRY